jgi:hypothetical protein
MLIPAGFEAIEARFGEPAWIVSGCALGIDTMWIVLAKERWTRARILLIVPQAYHNEALVKEFRRLYPRELDVLNAPGAPSAAQAYMARNDMLANIANVVAAHPAESVEKVRSGTWATIRRFRKLNKPIYIEPLDGAGGRWE